MKNPPLKIVVLCNRGHLGSLLLLNQLVKMKCYDIVGVVKTDHIHFSRKGLKKMKKHIWRSGALFISVLVMQQVIQELFFMLPFFKRKTKTAMELAHIYGFASHETESINYSETKEFIEELQPDLIVSAYFPHILKPHILSIPRLGTLNVHPGLIPEYKGVMPYFRVLKHNKKKAGVCIHWMDAGIDTGPIIAMKSFALSPNMSQDKVMIKTALIGCALLKFVGNKLQQGKQLPVISVSNKHAGYYSIPQHDDFKQYWSRHNYFSIRAMWKAIFGKLP